MLFSAYQEIVGNPILHLIYGKVDIFQIYHSKDDLLKSYCKAN